MKLFLTALAYLMTLILVAVTAFYLVIILAGPHGGLLSRSFETVVLVLGWLLVLVVPILVARLAWYRLSERMPSNSIVERTRARAARSPHRER